VILPCPPCPDCGARVRVDYDTTLRSNGRCVETLLEACPHERKRRGVCRLCARDVAGVSGRAAYCAGHRRYMRQVRDRRRKRAEYAANPEPVKAARRERYWQNPEAERARGRRRYARKAA
jgi:hypothetical protein